MPLLFRLTPADGSFCSRSPIEVAPEFLMSSAVRVSTGPTESASLRWMREPVTTISSTEVAASGWGAAA